ncbi:hypothetical protein BWI15_28265 [Kribbella sp. ALI-6-A]|uniref:hypothetical protein n=1 Tax=Kribbella sp. ALI-6-A TaxID=1933817 RepID=UPI00097BC163|nr:hypothetical protein [Kribbella sp. ALI-6-A]ONI67074.1 hypothetical protein BWI15_28265 [Kribbella sp. ALI-6-A]
MRELALDPRRYTDLHADLLDSRRTTDALRSHWYVLPLAALLHATARGTTGIVDLHVDSTQQLIELTSQRPVIVHSPTPADATLTLPATIAEAILTAQTTLSEALAAGNATLAGSGVLVEALGSR